MRQGGCPVPGVAHGQLDEPGLEGEPGTAGGLFDGFAISDGGEGAEQVHAPSDRVSDEGQRAEAVERIRARRHEDRPAAVEEGASGLGERLPLRIRHPLQLLRLVDREHVRTRIGSAQGSMPPDPGRTTSI